MATPPSLRATALGHGYEGWCNLKSDRLVTIAGVAILIACVANFVLIAVLIVEQYGLDTLARMFVPTMSVVVAVWAVIWQQFKVDHREADKREANSIAARAVMPPALLEIVRYAVECAAKIRSVYPEDGLILSATGIQVIAGHLICPTPESLAIPPIPYSALATMKECISLASREEAKTMARSVVMIQMHHSRMEAFIKSVLMKEISEVDCVRMLEDTIVLHAMNASLFIYARFQSENIAAESWKDDLYSSCYSCGVNDGEYRKLHATLKNVYDRDTI